MRHRFRILTPINAFFQNHHVNLAPGDWHTDDAVLAGFVRRYPGGAKYLGTEPIQPAPPQPGQFSQCPEPNPVINGALSGGGVAGAGKITPRR